MSTIGITIACGGRDDLLMECLASLGDFDGPVVVVCDGWKPTRDAAWPGRVSEIIHTTQRVGISMTWNAGIAALLRRGCDPILVQNDDTWLPPNWHYEFTRLFAEHPEVRCACAVDRNVAASVFPGLIPWSYDEAWQRLPPGRTQVEFMRYYGAAGFDEFAELWPGRLSAAGVPDFLPCRMNGASFALSRKAVQEDGLFDVAYAPPGTSEDYDMWMRLLSRHGPQVLGMATRVFVHHYRSATLSALNRQHTQSVALANNVLFRARWCQDAAPQALFVWLAGGGGAPGAQALPWDAVVPPCPVVPSVIP